MAIIYNGQKIAGKYKEQIIPDADTINKGIIKIATQSEVDEGTNNTSAITPLYLSSKQDVLTAGDNIDITNNIIKCDILPDNETIIQNNDKTFSVVGQKTKSNTIKFDWEGTLQEYNEAYNNGLIDPNWYCYITDDEQIFDYENSFKNKLKEIYAKYETDWFDVNVGYEYYFNIKENDNIWTFYKNGIYPTIKVLAKFINDTNPFYADEIIYIDSTVNSGSFASAGTTTTIKQEFFTRMIKTKPNGGRIIFSYLGSNEPSFNFWGGGSHTRIYLNDLKFKIILESWNL